jgi:5-deoxy-glucuronate isomerase
MSGLLRRSGPPGPDGAVLRVRPVDAGWRYVSFDLHRLAPGAQVSRPGDEAEVLVLILEGRASVRAGDAMFPDLGSRDSVFDGPPAPVVLVAPGTAVAVTAMAPALVALAAAPGGAVRRTAAIDPAAVFVEARGEGRTARRIHHLLPPTAAAGRLLAFEVYTPGGNWSSFPPHKHDTDDQPRESALEELYYYRFARPSGFACQRVYSADRSLDATLTVGDGDLVLVPRGYHVVAAVPGYDCYYLNIMAGPIRAWHFTVDPAHAWLMDWDPARPTGSQGPGQGG